MYYFMAMKAKVMKPTALFSSKFNYLSKKGVVIVYLSSAVSVI